MRRPTNQLSRLLLAGTVSATLLLAACGASTDTVEATTDSTTEVTAEATESTESTQPAPATEEQPAAPRAATDDDREQLFQFARESLGLEGASEAELAERADEIQAEAELQSWIFGYVIEEDFTSFPATWPSDIAAPNFNTFLSARQRTNAFNESRWTALGEVEGTPADVARAYVALLEADGFTVTPGWEAQEYDGFYTTAFERGDVGVVITGSINPSTNATELNLDVGKPAT